MKDNFVNTNREAYFFEQGGALYRKLNEKLLEDKESDNKLYMMNVNSLIRKDGMYLELKETYDNLLLKYTKLLEETIKQEED